MYTFAIKRKACSPFLWRVLLEPCLLLSVVSIVDQSSHTEIPSGAYLKDENPPPFPTRIIAIKAESILLLFPSIV